jgi:hypothetical protein
MEEQINILVEIKELLQDIFFFLQYQLGFFVGLFVMEKIFNIIKKFGGNK